MDINRSAINPHRLYTLLEAQALSGVSPADLIRLAGASLLNLCVLVPAGRRAYAVDPASVITWDSAAHLDRDVFHSKPSREHGLPERKDDVIAVVLDWAQCLGILDHGVTRQVFFRSAYAIEGGRSAGSSVIPLHLRPIRFPLFNSDGRSPADQSRWRFAIYPNPVQFLFTEGHGYPEPEDILIPPDSVRVIGRELSRLPREKELSAIDVDVAFDNSTAASGSVEDAEGLSETVVIDEAVHNAVDIAERASLDAVERDGTGVSSPARRRGEQRRDILQDDFGDISLLKREEVERLIKKGKTWIYERINRKHPRFDPTFPQPIQVGSGIGWIKSEVEAWWQVQIRNGIRKSRGTNPT